MQNVDGITVKYITKQKQFKITLMKYPNESRAQGDAQ